MGLTDRSRLGSIKSRQKRLQRELERVNSNLDSKFMSTSQSESVAENELSTQKEAWEKYLFAKAIYEESKDREHWRYMQKCISDYEKTIRSNSNSKVG